MRPTKEELDEIRGNETVAANSAWTLLEEIDALTAERDGVRNTLAVIQDGAAEEVVRENALLRARCERMIEPCQCGCPPETDGTDGLHYFCGRCGFDCFDRAEWNAAQRAARGEPK